MQSLNMDKTFLFVKGTPGYANKVYPYLKNQ